VLGSSWEKKMKDKAAKKVFNEIKTAAKDAFKDKRKVGAAGQRPRRRRRRLGRGWGWWPPQSPPAVLPARAALFARSW
jgi:hypothetical protein